VSGRAWCGAEAGGGGRIFLRQTQHEVADLVTGRWAAGPVRVGPLFPDQAVVSGQERGWCDDTVQTQPMGQQAGQGDRIARSGQEGRALLT
jgi:hypothetical protein